MWPRRVQDIGVPGGEVWWLLGGLEIDKVGEGARLTSD